MDFNNIIYSILLEGKIDDLKDQYSNHPSMNRDIVNKYHDALPEGYKSVTNLKWMLDKHVSGDLHPSDAENAGADISIMNHPDVKKHLEKKQISQYKSYNELSMAVGKHIDKLPVKDNSEVVYKSPTMKVLRHPDHKSAVFGAKLPDSNPEAKHLNCKASWCVSAGGNQGESYFNDYTDNGKHPMHTVEVTHPDGHTRKYAIIRGAREYRDEHDVSVDPEDFVMSHPEMAKTELGRNMLGRKAELFHDNGEMKPLHDVIAMKHGYEVQRNPLSSYHPDFNNVSVLSHIASNPEKYGKESSHFAYARASSIGEDSDIKGVLDKIKKSPAEFHPYTVALAINRSDVDTVKHMAKNLPDGFTNNQPLMNFIGGHKKLHPDDIHELMTDKSVPHEIKSVMVEHPNLGSATVNHIMNHTEDFDTNTKFNAARGSKISTEDIHSAVTNSNMDTTFRNGAAYNSKMKEETAKWILDNAEKESGGNRVHYMNLAANKIRNETTWYNESFEEMVINQIIK